MIMVDVSCDSASCSEENDGSMKKIRQEMKVGGGANLRPRQIKKNTLYNIDIKIFI